ncbi:MAG: hypothetical protein K0R69_2164 [Clostridia bacterium]|jgi:flagellar basal body-associated protein FliL|nr:hypothetical protein [Clostridia bacterium]
MKTRIKEFPLTLEEVKDLMKKENSKKIIWISLAIGVIIGLVGVIIWLAKKSCKDIEEHYEYFDDEYDESEDYDEYDDFDEEIYEDDDVEYVKIKDFMNYSEDEKAPSAESDTTADSEDAEAADNE